MFCARQTVQLGGWEGLGFKICRIKYCVFREIGYFLGIEFEAGSRWSQQEFKPQHLLDPRKLIARSATRLKSN